MADSEASDAGSNAADTGIDPVKDFHKLSDKEKKKLEKNLQKWRIFVDFIFRHVAIVTFRYNCFEHEEMALFLIALEKAESLRENTKLKKGEQPRISNFKVMKESSELLLQQRYLTEANRIKRFLDLVGRMRGLGLIANGFYRALKKGKIKGVDKIKYYLDHWRGFCVRTFDYAELPFQGVDPQTFNTLEQKYIVWPTVLRTSLHLSQRFLRRTSESTGLELMAADPKLLQKHMQSAEFVVATNIEDMLFQKLATETKSFLSNPLLNIPQQQQQQDEKSKFDLPDLEDIDAEFLKPIPDSGRLLEIPEEPPKEKKKGRKKKKSAGKNRGFSASSHKGKKKKKK